MKFDVDSPPTPMLAAVRLFLLPFYLGIRSSPSISSPSGVRIENAKLVRVSLECEAKRVALRSGSPGGTRRESKTKVEAWGPIQ